MSSYGETLEYIYSMSNLEARPEARASEHFDLGRMERLLEAIGNPHQRYKSVHVAGTKGKGSVCALVEAILRASGYRTGLYISPHLHTFRERVQVGGEYIGEDEVVHDMDELRPVLDSIPGLTTFEAATALGMEYFARKGVEIAVLEVGLGGRLDATNVVLPEVSIITSISHDHMAILGNTLAEIAAEKAGIIKPGVPTVSAPQAPEALEVIRMTCSERESPLTLVGQDWTWLPGDSSLEGQSFDVWSNRDPLISYKELRIPLLGAHQLTNATTAIAAMEILRRPGLEIREDSIRRGLNEVRWPGRLEVLNRAPIVVVDGAHNDDSCHQLAQALVHDFEYRRLILIYGALTGHDYATMLRELSAANPSVVLVTRSEHPRAIDVDTLRPAAQTARLRVCRVPTTPQALREALDLASADDLICACGSLSISAGVREAWNDYAGLPLPPKDPMGM